MPTRHSPRKTPFSETRSTQTAPPKPLPTNTPPPKPRPTKNLAVTHFHTEPYNAPSNPRPKLLDTRFHPIPFGPTSFILPSSAQASRLSWPPLVIGQFLPVQIKSSRLPPAAPTPRPGHPKINKRSCQRLRSYNLRHGHACHVGEEASPNWSLGIQQPFLYSAFEFRTWGRMIRVAWGPPWWMVWLATARVASAFWSAAVLWLRS